MKPIFSCIYIPFLTKVQLPSDSGRKASPAGIVASTSYRSHYGRSLRLL